MSPPFDQTSPSPSGRNCPIIYSTTCSYAIRAMCRLAMLNPDGYVSLHDVCEGSDLPATFIAKIFGDLVRARLLASTKGRGGGFALTRPPSEISLHDIVSVIDGVEQYRRCVVGLTKCDDKQPCAQHEKFKPIRTQILRYLSNTTLDKMSEALVSKIDLMNPPASPTSRV